MAYQFGLLDFRRSGGLIVDILKERKGVILFLPFLLLSLSPILTPSVLHGRVNSVRSEDSFDFLPPPNSHNSFVTTLIKHM
jgi:hypothetical protein